MKKKLLFTAFVFLAIMCWQGVFTCNVEATYYNPEISYTELWNNEIEVYATGKYIENANIPPTINGKKVTKISNFSDCTYLKSVTIPNTVTEMSISAFRGCTSLTSITIPSSIKEIPMSAFENCTALKTVSLPNSIEDIEMEAFQNCKSLTSITIPSKVKEIASGAFEGTRTNKYKYWTKYRSYLL